VLWGFCANDHAGTGLHQSVGFTIRPDLAETVDKRNGGAHKPDGTSEANSRPGSLRPSDNPSLNRSCPSNMETNTPKTAAPAAARVETMIATTTSPLSSKINSSRAVLATVSL
jgi:hypothetical protein